MEHRELDFMDTKEINLQRKSMRAVVASHILLIAILAGGGLCNDI